MSQPKLQHYFASSLLNWSVAATLPDVIRKQEGADEYRRRQDGTAKKPARAPVLPAGYAIYRVPLPLEAPYDIREYRPDVEGVEFVDEVRYDWK